MVLVLKFGGTSVSDGQKIKNIANYVLELKKEHEVVVVSSAMSKVTDFLEAAALEMREHEKDPDKQKEIAQKGVFGVIYKPHYLNYVERVLKRKNRNRNKP